MDWHKHFIYDESFEGCLVWRRDAANGRIKAGSVSGCPRPDKDTIRWTTKVGEKNYFNSRIIYEMFNGSILDNSIVDHKDGDTQNNKIENLRLISARDNSYNSKIRKNNSSGKTGVYKTHNGYSATYWTASCFDAHLNKKVSKHFSIATYGDDVAFQMATLWRKSKLDELKQSGFNITERHGK